MEARRFLAEFGHVADALERKRRLGQYSVQ